MLMDMDLGFALDQEQRQRNLPRLIEANYLLHLSAPEIEQLIVAELNANPALDLDELPVCPICSAPLEGGSCPSCQIDREQPTASVPEEEYDRFAEAPTNPMSDEEFDAVALIAQDDDPLVQLLIDARAALPESDHRTAEIIVSAIDPRGFLTSSSAEIARIAEANKSDVERVLRVIQ